ncbi:MAG TPA: NAD-dependent epimerase/dehydratase family protein [Burkholderiales bacterium]|nr:NAD-dependent epimerase/dehydratase family protein [Burkholderiales bacterium]
MIENSFEGSRVVVTGGSGFLASALIARLAQVKCRILRIVRPASPAPASPSGPAACELLRGDLRERAFCDAALAGSNYVFHFAAQTSVYQAERDPVADALANVQPMRNLVDAGRDRGIRPFILFSGSATQCGIPERLEVNESLPDRPVTAYDRHKLEAEGLLEEGVRRGWVRGMTLRLANIYGPGADRANTDRGILDQMMRRALRGEALTLYGEGGQLRDYVYVDDAVSAFLAAAVCAVRTDGRHFVLGTGEGRSLADAFALIARRAERLTGRKVTIASIPQPPGQSPIEGRSAIVNPTRFRTVTGWTPRITFPKGVDLTLQALWARPAEAA